MHRILATLLLAAISLTLMPMALLAGTSASDLPACCRKDGKHKCMMADADTDGPSLRRVSQCPMFPAHVVATAACGVAGVPVPYASGEVFATALLKCAAQAEAQYRISYSRSRCKRGPPACSSI